MYHTIEKRKLAEQLALALRVNQNINPAWGAVIGFSSHTWVGALPITDPDIAAVPRLAVQALLCDEIIFIAFEPSAPSLYQEEFTRLNEAANHVADPNPTEKFPSPWPLTVLGFLTFTADGQIVSLEGPK
jgi:hypothetical protein